MQVHSPRPTGIRLLLLGALATIPVFGAGLAGTPGLAGLDYAFRFASAIETDPKDRAKAQELALAEYMTAGAFEEASRRADKIEGWRRGVVYADLAASLARAGKRDEAMAFVNKAESIRGGVEGWQSPRISAHIAEALALLGDRERADTIVSGLAEADPVQYTGRAAATESVGLAAGGDFDAAMKRLADLEGNDDFDTASWRTNGYLALARREVAPRKGRLEALDAALRCSATLPLPRQVEVALEASGISSGLDRRRDGRASVQSALRAVDAAGVQTSEEIPYLIEIGRAWAALGEPEKAKASLFKAEGLVSQGLSIDQPGLLARIASGYRRIPEEATARRVESRALDLAAAMPLARPRALAVAAICRQMGHDRVPLDQVTQSRLDGLLAGLGDPW